MPRKRYSTEQIVTKLRQAEVELGRGLRTPQVCKRMCCNLQRATRARLVESPRLRLMPTRRTACGCTESVAEHPNRSPISPVPSGSCA